MLARARVLHSIAAATILLCLLGWGAYRGSLRSAFVYDDDNFVVLNESIRSLRGPRRFFTDPLTLAHDAQLARDNYRPLTTMSFALNHHFSKLEPSGYHLVNILLHLFNGVLVFLLALRLAERCKISWRAERSLLFAWLAGAVFLLHPVQTETVSWVSQRSGLLSLFFLLLSWHAYLCARAPALAWSTLSVVLFAASLLSKEAGVMLPFLLVLQDRFLLKGAPGSSPRPASAYAPYFLAVVALVAAKKMLVGSVAQTRYWGGDPLSTWLTTLKGFAVYVKLLIVPWPLSVEYLFEISRSLADPRALGALLLLCAILVFAWRQRRARPLAAFGIFWFFLSLAPVANIIPIRTVINERFLYLPLLGFALAASSVFIELLDARPRALGLGVAAWLLLYAGLTARRNLDWRDGDALVRATLKTCPRSPHMHYGLGRTYAAKGDLDSAAAEFKTALSLDPDRYEAINDLGIIAQRKGDLDLAALQYREALRVKGDYAPALVGLGNMHLKKGESAEAITLLEAALAADPRNTEIASNLAAAYGMTGDFKKAISLCERILAVRPDQIKTRYNLSLYYRSTGELARAKDALGVILTQAPDYEPARRELANLAQGHDAR